MDKEAADKYAYQTMQRLIEHAPTAFVSANTVSPNIRAEQTAIAMNHFVETFSALLVKRGSPAN